MIVLNQILSHGISIDKNRILSQIKMNLHHDILDKEGSKLVGKALQMLGQDLEAENMKLVQEILDFIADVPFENMDSLSTHYTQNL